MRYPKLTSMTKFLGAGLLSLLVFGASAQINTPYSRYGMGEILNARNPVSKGMGGIATTFFDSLTRSVNLINPASYSKTNQVTFDVGFEYESRNLKVPGTIDSYNSNNLAINYLAIAMPLMRSKNSNKTYWGLTFGLKPYSKIGYKVNQGANQPGIDSLNTTFNGDGGLFQAFVGSGIRYKNFAIGANFGAMFGQQNFSTIRSVVSVQDYYINSEHRVNTSLSGIFTDIGAQYDLKVGKKSTLHLAGNVKLANTLNGSRDSRKGTILYNTLGDHDTLDVAENVKDVKGKVELPVSYSIGAMYEMSYKFLVGVEYERTEWNKYSNYGLKDNVANSQYFRFGGQVLPTGGKSFFSNMVYRLGFYTGKDYFVATQGQVPVWAVTVGFGIPIRKYVQYLEQSSFINTSFEFGTRGNSKFPASENFFKINLGISLTDNWFKKRKFY